MLPSPAERLARAKGLLRSLLREIDSNTCTHEETHRGGSIWTICDNCDQKWADDRGGFVPHTDAQCVAAAREFLADDASASAQGDQGFGVITGWHMEGDLRVYDVRSHSGRVLRFVAAPEGSAQGEGIAAFVEQMDMLVADYQKYDNGARDMPFGTLRVCLTSALQEYLNARHLLAAAPAAPTEPEFTASMYGSAAAATQARDKWRAEHAAPTAGEGEQS